MILEKAAELGKLLEAPDLSKNASAQYIASVTGYTPNGVWNVIRSLTALDVISRGGAMGIMDLIGIFFATLGNSATKAPAAVRLFLNEMRLINNHDAPDRQPHLKAADDTPLGLFLASILLDGGHEIRRSNWTLSIMSNPPSVEIACGIGSSRRVFLFMSPDHMVSKPLVRSAKIVPAEVLAGLSDLILKGEGNREGPDA